jgi:hypothetical protein
MDEAKSKLEQRNKSFAPSTGHGLICPYPDPPIRTLKVELLSGNSTTYVPCIPNSREPTPFETEFFKGIAMIVIRTNPIDPNFADFFDGKLVRMNFYAI